jgi:hypothetical protein
MKQVTTVRVVVNFTGRGIRMQNTSRSSVKQRMKLLAVVAVNTKIGELAD